MQMKKIILIIIPIIIIIVIIAYFISKKDNITVQNNPITHEEVEKIYENMETTECLENCDNKKYVSKLYGYTYDKNDNIQIDVKEGYIENNKVYDLDGNLLGDYNEKSLDKILEKGTLKSYIKKRS